MSPRISSSLENVSLGDGAGEEGIFTSCCSRFGGFVGWRGPFWGSAETPGEVGQESGALASTRHGVRTVVRLRGRGWKCRSFYQVYIFRVDGNETSVSSFSLNS